MPVAGWYADPGDPTRWRYWNGTTWTEWISDESQRFGPGAPADSAWEPPVPGPKRGSKSRDLATVSIVVSVGTLLCFLDLFAPFTGPVAIVLGLVARRSTESGSGDRKRANLSIWLGVATLALWPLLIPVYNGLNAGL
jgi:hypothetical protein